MSSVVTAILPRCLCRARGLVILQGSEQMIGRRSPANHLLLSPRFSAQAPVGEAAAREGLRPPFSGV